MAVNGSNLPGQTAASLTIGSVQTNNVGAIPVIVSNVICWESATAGLGLTCPIPWAPPSTLLLRLDRMGPCTSLNTANTIFALDAVVGGIKWSTNLGSGYDNDITSSAAVAANGSAVYVGSLDGTLYALNTTNGAVLWSNQLGGSIYSSPAISASDGTIYVGTWYPSSYGLFAINPATRATNWFFETDDPNSGQTGIDSSPAIGPDCTIYFLVPYQNYYGDLYTVSPNGALQWFFPLPGAYAPASSPAIGADGTIYVGSGDGYLYAISPSGTLEWIFDTGDGQAINSSPAIGGDGTVYIGSTDGNLYAITNGGLKWQFTATTSYGYPIFFISSPALSEDGVIYIGGEDYWFGVNNFVYAITNDAVKWTYPTGGSVVSSPAINPADGAVIIASEDGYVYKRPGSGSLAANAPWPMFHQNVRHTGAVPNPACSGGGVAFPNNPGFSSGYSTFSFYLSGTPGSLWYVFASSDLANWSQLGNVSLDSSSGTEEFFDDTVAGVTNRFYMAQSGNSCSPVIGFINMTIPPGKNLIANQFYQVNDGDSPQNTANGLLDFLVNNGFSSPYLPGGTEIMKWNGNDFESDTYDAVNKLWSTNGDATLLPGEAAFIINPTSSSLTIPFVGLVLQGLSANPIVAGTNYVSSIVPQAGRIQSDLGYKPNTNDQVLLWTGNGFSTHTYSGSGWSSGEPVLNVGQGFVLVASQTNLWQQSLSACQPGFFVVPSNPLWTDTGIFVNSNDTVIFTNVSGIWNGGPDQGQVGPGGEIDNDAFDCFLTTNLALHDSLIAFVGPNPYYWGTTNEWVYGNTYFPQGANTNGYWPVGTNGTFTTDRAGELWFGFNDDAVNLQTNDNSGSWPDKYRSPMGHNVSPDKDQRLHVARHLAVKLSGLAGREVDKPAEGRHDLPRPRSRPKARQC